MKADRSIREKKLNRIAIVLSCLVFLVVGLMRRIKIPIDFDLSFLPAVNATLNSTTAILLILGLFFIKQKNIKLHKRTMSLAIILSSLFLVCYVAYHLTTPETKFGGEGLIRTVYLVILLTHIVLAAVILPFILFTYIRAITGSYERHKKLARLLFPFWLYVAISGPVIFWMLRPYY